MFSFYDIKDWVYSPTNSPLVYAVNWFKQNFPAYAGSSNAAIALHIKNHIVELEADFKNKAEIKVLPVNPPGGMDKAYYDWWNSISKTQQLAELRRLDEINQANKIVVDKVKTQQAVDYYKSNQIEVQLSDTLMEMKKVAAELNRQVKNTPEYIQNVLSASDKREVENIYKMEKLVKDSNDRYLAYQKEEAERQKKYWDSDASRMEKLLQGMGYLSSPDYLQRISENVEVGPLVEPIVKEAVKETLDPHVNTIKEVNEGVKYIKENLQKVGYGVMRGAGDLFEDIGLTELKDVVNTIQDQGVRYIASLAASEAAFRKAQVPVTELPKDYVFGMGTNASKLMEDQIRRSIETSMQVPLQSFAESLGQFRAYYNTINQGVSYAQSSGKYRYSKVKKNGYIKSKHGNYYIQAIR